ncbi:monovalent cation/H+ antiporter complex subunit F [Lachnospiraceae bacterium 64-25]
MSEGISTLDKIYQGMYIAVLVILAVMLFACLIRAVRGPRIADRIVAVNMMGTMVMVMIAVLSLLLKEGFLVDICLIYALVSFLAVTVISKVYIGVYAEKRQAVKREAEGDNGEGNKEGDDLHGNS